MKTCIFIILLALVPKTKAQLNTSFEEWTNNGQYEDLTVWSTPNMYFSVNNKTSCSKQSPHWGKFSLGISPICLPSFNDTLPGYALQANSIDKRPGSISIYYRYPCMKTDSPNISVYYYKGKVDTANMIGSCVLHFKGAKDWTKASANIQWKSAEVPDSFIIMIINAFNNVSDTLFVDDLEISAFNTSLTEASQDKIRIYVTSDRQAIFNGLSGKENRLVVSNILGETVFNETVEGSANLDSLAPGLHVLQLITSEGTITRKCILY